MDTFWIAGTLIAIMFFIIVEALAFRHPERINTLSRCIYDIGKNWPLSIFLMGMFCGGLAVHFFWHWCPPGSQSVGMLLPPKNQDSVCWTINTNPPSTYCKE